MMTKVKKKRRAMLNVGGVKHEVMWGMLLQVLKESPQSSNFQSKLLEYLIPPPPPAPVNRAVLKGPKSA